MLEYVLVPESGINGASSRAYTRRSTKAEDENSEDRISEVVGERAQY